MKRLRLLGLALPLAGIVFLVVSLLVGGASGSSSSNTKLRWDIINLDFATLTISPGGHASAFATGGGGAAHAGKITLTGSGTFRSNPGKPQDVTGGGTWTTYAADGTTVTGNGMYQVSGFVDFDLAPGFLPITDHVGNAADAHSGLVVLKVAYDDGSDGILVVSCDLPGGSPPTLFEGITASKGYIDYWERDPAVGGVNANRTAFHEVH